MLIFGGYDWEKTLKKDKAVMIRTIIKKGKAVMIRTDTNLKAFCRPAPLGSGKKLLIFGGYDWDKNKKRDKAVVILTRIKKGKAVMICMDKNLKSLL